MYVLEHCRRCQNGQWKHSLQSNTSNGPRRLQKNAIESGAIALNCHPAPSIHTIVRNGDVISHTMHRHEPPVTARSIGVVHEDEELIVIDKPAGVPVHPTGRYNYNSVVEIIRSDRGQGFNPLPCNRLDRLTSGLMFLGKTSRAAEAMGRQLTSRSVRKEYVARVVGEFPDGEIVCDQPILLISPKLGLNRVRPHGKNAKTVFHRIAYYPPQEQTIPDPALDSAADISKPDTAPSQSAMSWKHLRGYSIVRCLPVTGRTHQIRVHLQFLGHPITNDPIYSNQAVFGPALARGDASDISDADIIARLSRMGKTEVAQAVAYHEEVVGRYEKAKAEKMTGEICKVCATPLYSDPGPHELGIYLHARKYACADGKWAYESPLPEWALPPGGEDVRDCVDGLVNEVKKLTVEDEEIKVDKGKVDEGG